MSLIIAGTGHRPNKLGGYSPSVLTRLTDLARASLVRLAPEQVISGGALGWDTALALAALDLDIYLTIALPCDGQDAPWTDASKRQYKEICDRADNVINVCPGAYSAQKMKMRDRWMIDKCDRVLAIWNGTQGGTGYTVNYAKSVDRPITNVWNSWVKYRGF